MHLLTGTSESCVGSEELKIKAVARLAELEDEKLV